VRVFLTGGTGLLGSHLAQTLRAGGHTVLALCRPGAERGFLEGLGCEVAEGDVRESPGELGPRIRGCSHVVHAAALVYEGGSWAGIRAVNVEGTRNVAEGAAAAGARHLLHVSSVAVYGTAEGALDEERPLYADLPVDDHYARSKREAEQVARAVERSASLPVTVIRPSAVYGERDRLMVPALAKLVSSPWVPIFGPGTNSLPVVYAGNVAEAMALMMEAGEGGPAATYDVGLDYPLSQRALFHGLALGLGRRPRFVPVPAALVRSGVALLSRLGVAAPGARHLPLKRVARLALGENPYPSRRVRDRLGWKPSQRHAEALERTGRWYRDAHGQHGESYGR
jgi:nucleoside-diphosphate-sugar epimerase